MYSPDIFLAVSYTVPCEITISNVLKGRGVAVPLRGERPPTSTRVEKEITSFSVIFFIDISFVFPLHVLGQKQVVGARQGTRMRMLGFSSRLCPS